VDVELPAPGGVLESALQLQPGGGPSAAGGVERLDPVPAEFLRPVERDVRVAQQAVMRDVRRPGDALLVSWPDAGTACRP
jgi:hypothetical protein